MCSTQHTVAGREGGGAFATRRSIYCTLFAFSSGYTRFFASFTFLRTPRRRIILLAESPEKGVARAMARFSAADVNRAKDNVIYDTFNRQMRAEQFLSYSRIPSVVCNLMLKIVATIINCNNTISDISQRNIMAQLSFEITST